MMFSSGPGSTEDFGPLGLRVLKTAVFKAILGCFVSFVSV